MEQADKNAGDDGDWTSQKDYRGRIQTARHLNLPHGLLKGGADLHQDDVDGGPHHPTAEVEQVMEHQFRGCVLFFRYKGSSFRIGWSCGRNWEDRGQEGKGDFLTDWH